MLRPSGFWRVLDYFCAQMYILPKGGANTTSTQETTKPLPTCSTTATVTESKGATRKEHGTGNLNLLPIPTIDETVTRTSTGQTTPVTLATTPSESDPLVGWVYKLQKAELIKEMAKYQLDTEGKTKEYLRKAFVLFLRSQANRTSDTASGGADSFTTMTTEPPGLINSRPGELQSQCGLNIREILEVHPDTSDNEVRKLLVALKLKSRQHREESAESRRLNLAPQDNMTTSTFSEAFHQPIPTFLQHGPSRRHVGEPNLEFGNPVSYNRPVQPPEMHYTNPENKSKQPLLNPAEICSAVRKWNLNFDGERNPISFLERLDELMEAYNISGDDLIKALPELFKGMALLWYRNNREFWTNYEDFRYDFELNFLPAGYRLSLDDEIKRRTQGETEPIRAFSVALNTLMRRRGGMTPTDRLDRLYTNMHPKYKLSMKRQDVRTINQLIMLAEHYETYVREKSLYRPPPAPAQSLVPETAYKMKHRSHNTYDVAPVAEQPKADNTAHNTSPINQQASPHNRKSTSEQIHSIAFRTQNDRRPKTYGRQNDMVRPDRIKDRPENIDNQTGNDFVCWNCGKSGHLFRNCWLPRSMKCFYCKTPDIKTTDCKCKQGNGSRAQVVGGPLRPQPNQERPPKNGKTGLSL